jgi:hypothetical protein
MRNGRDKGAKKEVRGYWVDVICGPYFSFGVDCGTVSLMHCPQHPPLTKDALHVSQTSSLKSCSRHTTRTPGQSSIDM